MELAAERDLPIAGRRDHGHPRSSAASTSTASYTREILLAPRLQAAVDVHGRRRGADAELRAGVRGGTEVPAYVSLQPAPRARRRPAAARPLRAARLRSARRPPIRLRRCCPGSRARSAPRRAGRRPAVRARRRCRCVANGLPCRATSMAAVSPAWHARITSSGTSAAPRSALCTAACPRGLLLVGRLGQPIRRHHRVVGLRVVFDQRADVIAQRQQRGLGLIQRARDPRQSRFACGPSARPSRPATGRAPRPAPRPIRRQASEWDRRTPRAASASGAIEEGHGDSIARIAQCVSVRQDDQPTARRRRARPSSRR